LVDAEGEQLGEHADDLAHHAQADAAQGIRPGIRDALAPPAHQQLDGDEQQEDRRGEDDDLGVLHAAMLGRRTAAGCTRMP